jgi:hypothetical protein
MTIDDFFRATFPIMVCLFIVREIVAWCLLAPKCYAVFVRTARALYNQQRAYVRSRELRETQQHLATLEMQVELERHRVLQLTAAEARASVDPAVVAAAAEKSK